ncbi:hypothetical protein PI124_g4209 [Phytophthora idaei]|nr:hypothetical protein PI125_g3724 [Phytophthora idaei]KAG3167087.1 hypothetical protein PI126_g3932 [Phytophthora idaei]KAG3251171.1 hypothetical protein PI124_g4209 [Phytophthora idaei]
MSHQERQEPMVFIHMHSIGRLEDERNPKTVAALTETVAEELQVSPVRVSIYLKDISAKQWQARFRVVNNSHFASSSLLDSFSCDLLLPELTDSSAQRAV